MRSVVAKTFAAMLVAVVAFGFVAPIASAQVYPPVAPAPAEAGPPGDELLAIIQANNAVAAAEAAAASGDAAAAQAAADTAADLLAAAKADGASATTIATLTANSNAAAASAKAAAAGNAASAPLAVAVPLPNLAFTGSSASLPAALGAALIGAGGLTVLFARKREHAQA